MASIPAEQLVSITPSVLAVGGTGRDITGLMLTSSALAPIGSVLSFSDAEQVSDYFGPSSQEASLAAIYFEGFEGKNKTPAALLFSQYNQTAVAAYLRSGDVSSMTLTELQAINGTLLVTMDGYSRNGGTVNLSGATSFSSAAGLIQTALNSAPATLGTFTASIAATTMTVTGSVTGTPLAVGQTVTGGGVTAGTRITALGTGTGGAGTYTINNSQTVGSTTLTTQPTPVTVGYSSDTGAFTVTSGITGAPSTAAFATGTISASLELTQATGAVLSQGAAAVATPAAFMTALIAVDRTWTNFMTTFDPDGGSGSTLKQAFAAWKNTQNNRFGYVCWDTDQSPLTQNPANASLGQILAANSDSGTFLIDGDEALGWDDTTGPEYAAFVCGAAASIDFDETNGRTSFAYRRQDGLAAMVSDGSRALSLGGNPQTADRANGYNFYGAYGDAGAGAVASIWLQRGFVTGAFAWFDSFVNQVWLNSFFRQLMLAYFGATKSTPYNSAGYAALEQALMPAINQGLAFGAFAPGTISASQIAQVNTAAGARISDTLQTQGWYLQIRNASDAARAARTSPPATFWYLDRGSVQSFALSSVEVQ